MAKKESQSVAVIKEGETAIYREQTPNDLIALAIDKNLDIEKLQKLMEMQEKWQAKQAERSYFEAFGKFQAIAPELIKNKQVKYDHKDGGGQTNYKYQELGDIAKHIREPLAECGLSYRWDQKEEGKIITVWCIISHTGGHQERSQPLQGEYDTSGKKNSIQQKASTITYLRRYTLTGMLGLSTMEGDNDGKGGAQPEPTPTFTGVPSATAEQFASIMKRVIKDGEKAITEAQKHFSFTEDQIQSLKIAADAKDKKS